MCMRPASHLWHGEIEEFGCSPPHHLYVAFLSWPWRSPKADDQSSSSCSEDVSENIKFHFGSIGQVSTNSLLMTWHHTLYWHNKNRYGHSDFCALCILIIRLLLWILVWFHSLVPSQCVSDYLECLSKSLWDITGSLKRLPVGDISWCCMQICTPSLARSSGNTEVWSANTSHIFAFFDQFSAAGVVCIHSTPCAVAGGLQGGDYSSWPLWWIFFSGAFGMVGLVEHHRGMSLGTGAGIEAQKYASMAWQHRLRHIAPTDDVTRTWKHIFAFPCQCQGGWGWCWGGTCVHWLLCPSWMCSKPVVMFFVARVHKKQKTL